MNFFKRIRFHAIHREGERSAVLDLARGRILLLGGFFAILYCVLAVRVFDVSVLHSAFLVSESEDIAQIPQVPLKQERGMLQDRNGAMLATTLDMPSLYADPALIADPAATAAGLKAIFPSLSKEKMLRDLSGQKRFVWVQRFITPEQLERVMMIGEPGLSVRYEPKRVYPMKNEFSHIIGVTDVDQKGLSGLERGMNAALASGGDVRLTMDARLQHAVHKALAQAMDDFSASGGAGIIMDARNGAILAAVSLPDFNPHARRKSVAGRSYFNRLTQGVYELGSVFKIFSMAAYLESYPAKPMDTVFDAREPLKIAGFTISDYHAQKRLLTMPEVFMHSSNIGSAMMGEAVGGKRLREFYADLGLLDPIEFEVPEVAAPLLPPRWGQVQTMTTSYGHGIAVSPMHVVAAMAPIVNGGFAVRPHFVQRDIDHSSRLRVFSGATVEKMRQLLRLVVTDGTGGRADVAGYQVGGKTGTAEKVSVSGGYDHHARIASFLGAFPMSDPRYVVFVMIDEPEGNKASFGYATAGWVAAPAAQQIVKSMVNILGLEPFENLHATPHPYAQYIAVEG